MRRVWGAAGWWHCAVPPRTTEGGVPRYFITTHDGFRTHDDQGLIVSGPDELAMIVRQSLATMLHDEGVTSDQV